MVLETIPSFLLIFLLFYFFIYLFIKSRNKKKMTVKDFIEEKIKNVISKYDNEKFILEEVYKNKLLFYENIDNDFKQITFILDSLSLEINNIWTNDNGFFRLYAKSKGKFEFFDSSKRIQIQKEIDKTAKSINKLFLDSGLKVNVQEGSLENNGIADFLSNTVVFDFNASKIIL
jgi:hypothetical protein